MLAWHALVRRALLLAHSCATVLCKPVPCCSKLSQHVRSKSVDMVGLAARQGRGSEEAASGTGQQQQPVGAHPRARSCSPAEFAAMADCVAGPAAPADSSGSAGGMPRSRSSLPGSQLRPPRPPAPAAQQPSAAQQPVAALQQQQQQQTASLTVAAAQQQAERSPFDVYNVASAVASALMPQFAWPQQGGGAAGSFSRQAADAEEAALLADGDGWESVDVSDASFHLQPRDFSSAHLLAPLVDQSAVGSMTLRASSSSGGGGGARKGFAGGVRAKVGAGGTSTLQVDSCCFAALGSSAGCTRRLC